MALLFLTRIQSSCETRDQLLCRAGWQTGGGVGGGGGHDDTNAHKRTHTHTPVLNATCSSPRSHSLTLSSLHEVIGSMLGVLLHSLLQLPAVLADFYLSGLLEEEGGKADPEVESDDDESPWPLAQVKVRIPPPLPSLFPAKYEVKKESLHLFPLPLIPPLLSQ